MNSKPAIVAFSILLVVAIAMIVYKTKVEAPQVDMNPEVSGPVNDLPIAVDVSANQEGQKVFEVSNGSLTFTGSAPGTMFFEASFPIYFEDEMGGTPAQGLAHANGDWMTTSTVPFTATLQVKPITEPVSGTIVFKRDNPSGLPEHDFELRMPAVLKNK